MKKQLFTFAAALACGLAFTACSNDDDAPQTSFNKIPVMDDSQAIVFSTNWGTRGGSTLTNLTAFYSNIYTAGDTPQTLTEGTTFSWDAADQVFKSNPVFYWPMTGNLDFYAINYQGDGWDYATKSYAYSQWDGTRDLVSAIALAGEKQRPYPLTFKHLCSQIAVSAEASDVEKGEALTYRIKDIRLMSRNNGTYTFGTATGAEGTWTPAATPAWGSYSYAEALPGNGMEFPSTGKTAQSLTDMCWDVLPVAQGEIYFDIEYQIFQNGQMIADFTGQHRKVCKVANPGFEMGKRYVFNFKLDKENGTTPDGNYPNDVTPDGDTPDGGGGATAIEYTMTMAPWSTATTTTVTTIK